MDGHEPGVGSHAVDETGVAAVQEPQADDVQARKAGHAAAVVNLAIQLGMISRSESQRAVRHRSATRPVCRGATARHRQAVLNSA
jgi:hypothetical protein